MRVLGYRKSGIGVLYIFFAIFGIDFIAFGIFFSSVNEMYLLYIIPGLMLVVMSLWTLVGYYSTPKEAIILLNENELQIGHGIKVDIDDITDVSYIGASGRGYQVRWGSVIVYSNEIKYKVRYIADCERVAKELTSLMYERKMRNNSQQIPTV